MNKIAKSTRCIKGTERKEIRNLLYLLTYVLREKATTATTKNRFCSAHIHSPIIPNNKLNANKLVTKLTAQIKCDANQTPESRLHSVACVAFKDRNLMESFNRIWFQIMNCDFGIYGWKTQNNTRWFDVISLFINSSFKWPFICRCKEPIHEKKIKIVATQTRST